MEIKPSLEGQESPAREKKFKLRLCYPGSNGNGGEVAFW